MWNWFEYLDLILGLALVLIIYPTLMYLIILPIYMEDLNTRVHGRRDFWYYTVMYVASPLIVPLIVSWDILLFITGGILALLLGIFNIFFFVFGQLILGMGIFYRDHTFVIYRRWRCLGNDLVKIFAEWDETWKQRVQNARRRQAA